MRELSSARFGNWFATPLLEHVWADAPGLNERLLASILDEERRHAGNELTNTGGWHSETGRLEFCAGAGQKLIQHMGEMVEEATSPLRTVWLTSPPP